ncbi:MAG: CvpA family protein [Pseudomonadota bacterium]
MIGPISFLDAILIAVALLSALLAMYRGLTREILSILSWIVAAGAVLYFVLYQEAFANDIAAQTGLNAQIAKILIGAIIFLIVLVIVHLITSRISDSILDSRVGMFDRILGFMFGVLRGFVLVVIPFLFYEKLYPDRTQHPSWVQNSVSVPYLRSAGSAIESALLQYVPDPLTEPSQEQQGALPEYSHQFAFVLNRGVVRISVTHTAS